MFAKMSDDEIANLLNSAITVDMPNHLADVPDITQNVVYKMNLNEKPTVLDTADFDKYLKDNKIPKSEILVRSINGINYTSGNVHYRFSADQLHDMTRYGQYNYIGGKNGGQALGGGTYFDKTGGRNSGYGGTSMRGVLSPKARKIDVYQIDSEWNTYTNTHPKAGQALRNLAGSGKGGNPRSIKALIMGYNVVTRGDGYHNIIDRSALILDKNNF